MLSKRDLLLATVARKKTDRIPIAMWRHFPLEDQDPESFVKVEMAFQREYDFDFMKVMPSWLYTMEDYGGTAKYIGHPMGIVTSGPPPIKSIEQWEAMKPLDVTKGALARELGILRMLAKVIGDTPFIQTVFSPFMLAGEMTGDPMASGGVFLVWMRKYPEAFQRGLATLTETWANYTTEVMKTGAAGIFYAVNKACYSLMNWGEYEKFGVPGDRAILEAARPGWFNLLHVHGEDLMFEHLASYPVQAFNWYDRQTWPSLKDGKALFPGAVMGGIDHERTLLLAQPDKVAAEVKDGIAQTGGIGYIAGPGCGYPVAVTNSNVHAAVAAARSGAG
jgi:uroporphyrinogen decarboxylase